MTNQLTTIVTLNSWNAIIKQANTLFESISNEEMLKEVAPNRNTGAYLLGHLVGVHDRMLPLLGIGEPMWPVKCFSSGLLTQTTGDVSERP